MATAEFLTVLIVIYLRVSSEDQKKKGYSIPEQREQCQAKAQELVRELEAELGHRVQMTVKEFEDVFGGDIEARPVLEEVRAFVRANRPRYFVCLNPDRFSRDLEIALRVTKEIRAIGAELEFVDVDFSDDAEGMLQFQVRGAVSEYEKKSILKRTYRGMLRKVKQGGRPNGAAPYGYRHNKVTDQLEIHEPEAQWIRRMFEWVAFEHIGAESVAQRLNAAGVATKKGARRWYRGVVATILQNTSYIGQMRCQRRDLRGIAATRKLPKGKRPPTTGKIRPQAQWITVPIPPLISREIFDQAQANFGRNCRGGRRDTGMLSMLVRCGSCGGAMGYSRHSGTGKFHVRCPRRWAKRLSYKDPTPCTNGFHRATDVETKVWIQIVTWLTQPEILEAYLLERSQSDNLAQQITALQEEQQQLKNQVDEKYRMQRFTIQSVAQGVLTEAAATATLAEVTDQVRYLEGELELRTSRIAALQATQAAAANVVDRFRAIKDQVAAESELTREQLEALDAAERRHLVLDLISHVILYDDGRIEIEPRE